VLPLVPILDPLLRGRVGRAEARPSELNAGCDLVCAIDFPKHFRRDFKRAQTRGAEFWNHVKKMSLEGDKLVVTTLVE
jgi:hypothetical protein